MDDKLVISFDDITFGHGEVEIIADSAFSSIHTHSDDMIPSPEDFMCAFLKKEKFFCISLKDVKRIQYMVYVEMEHISFKKVAEKLSIIENKICDKYAEAEDKAEAEDDWNKIIKIMDTENEEMNKEFLEVMKDSVIIVRG